MYVKTIFVFKLIQSEEQWRKTWRTKKTPKLCCLTLMISSLATIYLSGLRKEFKLSANIKQTVGVPLNDICSPVVIFLRLM